MQRLLELDEVEAAVHEDRERILIRTSADLGTITTVLTAFWQDVADDLARPGSG